MKYLKITVLISFVLSVIFFGIISFKSLTSKKDLKPEILGATDTLTLNCDYDQKDLLKGLKAIDDNDGDITDNIIVGNLSKFYEKGKSKVTYIVFDSSNQSATFTRKIIFKDYDSPKFSLNSPLVFKESSDIDILDFVSAQDKIEGDISNRIRISKSNVNLNVAGDYFVELSVTNYFGDISKITLPVKIVTAIETRYNIILKDYLLYLKKGDSFNPTNYLIDVKSSDGKSYDKQNVKISSSVSTNKSGTYNVTYTYLNGSEIYGTSTLNVIVE